MRHRTALIIAGAIGAVVFAGAIAVGANLGILTVADSSSVGQLSAATVVQTTGGKPTPQVASSKKAASSQTYIIKKAGSVKVAFSKLSVRLLDVSAKRHWKWKLAQSGDKKLTVTFGHGSNTYTFTALVGRHGKLTAKVDHPITRVIPAAPSSGSTVWTASPASSAPAASSTRSTHAGGESGDRESHNGGGADD